jgi:hypothetical protein
MGTFCPCFHGYAWFLAVLHNNGNILLMISGVTSCLWERSKSQSITDARKVCSVCYRASGEQDTSLYVVVLSSLWQIVTDSH